MVWASTVPEMDDFSSGAVWSRGVSCRPVENEKKIFRCAWLHPESRFVPRQSMHPRRRSVPSISM
jgi:hypothetical protein